MARFFNIVLLLGLSLSGVGGLSIAVASFVKARQPAVIRNGFYSDYMNLGFVMGGIGAVAVILIVVMLVASRRRKPAPPASHF